MVESITNQTMTGTNNGNKKEKLLKCLASSATISIA
jgi:hypothetical protein